MLSRVLYTVSSSIAALEPEPLARSSLYECAQAVLHSGAELDPLAVRQLYNVVEGKEGRESAVFKATLKASKYMQAEASDGLDFASIDLLARRPTSMALLAVNVEDILRIASHKGALEKLREPANAQRANIAVSRLAHIAAQPEYPVQIRSAAVQTLSALGHAQMVQSVTVQSPFSFGYRRLPESEKGARSTHFALYAHSLHLLFYAALEAGANDVALCARDVLRVLLPNLADRKALSIDQSTHYAVFVDDLAGAVPPRSLYPRMPTDGILAGDCLSGSASKSRSQWLVQTYAALVPHTHSKGTFPLRRLYAINLPEECASLSIAQRAHTLEARSR